MLPRPPGKGGLVWDSLSLAPTARALVGPALAPRGDTTLPPLFGGIQVQQPSQTSSPKPGCGQTTPPKGLSDTLRLTPLSDTLTASAPLGPGSHKAFQRMQTPGQGRARALGGIPRTAAGCTTGQVSTCLCSVARTHRPSGWRTERGQRPVLPPPSGGRGPGLPDLAALSPGHRGRLANLSAVARAPCPLQVRLAAWPSCGAQMPRPPGTAHPDPGDPQHRAWDLGLHFPRPSPASLFKEGGCRVTGGGIGEQFWRSDDDHGHGLAIQLLVTEPHPSSRGRRQAQDGNGAAHTSPAPGLPARHHCTSPRPQNFSR
ncbi:uncharacterized protein LOC112411565 [Neophocaena asiaeorientalis asiaeorientalis]|uniref:Uncharacterized protein LOC112411565 n=1 Tax=Neophocaena asiaeorientalis asiaeorientalis TaxID=1706337 RepID=A0A341CXG6_NEOAA|nr:uncharacterized protein LOC112411565 [Neophocaena asiaeorientalis asiaeorientalis]XP_024618563.1 uncharacterized protein LOC112411565 [Neophocaena asiaeorientalis asiaeorientalis]